ncbi:YHYH protein [Nocardioides sp.]|uniref:YHYH protein n=1 Tax=Nocardioides sp. TaxID=35761 RepID=UPI0035625ABF
MAPEPHRLERARRPLPRSPFVVLGVAALFLFASCGTGSDESTSTITSTSTPSSESSSSESSTSTGLDTDLFFDGALAEEPTTEDCTLSDGTETTCYSITVAGYPSDHEVGPFCPETITDDADAGGIWLDGENVYDLDGQFIEDLAETYGDSTWKMYDEDGNVLVTETQEEFEAAARPDVDPDLQNHCVEGKLEWLENGEPIQTTVLIPTTPVAAAEPSSTQAILGVTLDGVRIDASAPVDAILSAYTIAAFDDCGGHFNPFEGYHLHGAVGCSEVDEVADGDTAQFGYALDGYPVHSPYAEGEAPDDLDECNGHTTEADGYHYHANSAAENLVIACLVGQTVQSDDAGGGPPPNG